MTKDELNELTKPELIKHAETIGIKLTPVDNKGDMVDKILGINNVRDMPKRDANMPVEGSLHTMQGEKVTGLNMFKVTIYADETERGDVPIAVNGHLIKIQRGKEVIISEPYLEALKHSAIETQRFDQETGKMVPTSRLSYTFTASPA